MRRWPVLPAIFAAAAILAPIAGAAHDGYDPLGRLFHLRVTQYYTAIETDYPIGYETAFISSEGGVLYWASAAFFNAAATEGSARLINGRVINHRRSTASEVHWSFVDAHYGKAANGCDLVPYRSAAIDPGEIPLGSRIRIAETVGLPLPDGGMHDGVWWAVDTGPSIVDDRIDLFTGSGIASMELVYAFGIGHMQPLTVEILETDAGCP